MKEDTPGPDTTSYRWASAPIMVMGLLFALGSALFALGSVDAYFLGRYTQGFEFFIASLLFTVATFLQYVYLLKKARPSDEIPVEQVNPSVASWSIRIQFLGAISFNISTGLALKKNLMVSSLQHQVWSPDFFGSLFFLLASGMLWFDMHQNFRYNHDISWWNATFNFLGAWGFISASLVAYIFPKTEIPSNEIIMNLATFIGSICFLLASLLLLIDYKLD